jgi:uncharacterized protein YndB with AHSA1/START domain
VFEATYSRRIRAPAPDVWALWVEPGRWPDWDERVDAVEVEYELGVGSELGVKLRRGGRLRYEVTALEPEHLLAIEARFPGARLAQEHRISAGRDSLEVTHRIRVDGPLSGFWALMMSRKRLREAVARMAAREGELTERGALARRPRKHRR